MEALTLRPYQSSVVDDAARADSYGIFAETGTGKTPIGIELIRRCGSPALVVCPLSIIEPAWLTDLHRFAQELRGVSLWGTAAQRRRAQQMRGVNVYVVNFEAFWRMVAKDDAWLRAVPWRTLVVDESSKMKDPRTKTAKMLLRFALGEHGWPGVPHRFPMSGTPAPNIEYEYWAQMRLVQPTLFDESFFRFQRRWFFPVVSDKSNPRIVWKWGIRKADREAMLAKIATRATFLRKTDCLDLPDQVDATRHVKMGREQQRAYDSMFNDFVTSVDPHDLSATAMASNKLAQLMKLRQITAGCLATLDGTMRWTWDAKLKIVQEIVDELGEQQAIVWTQFHVEADAYERLLGDHAVVVDGRIPNSDRPARFEAFRRGDVQYLIAHPRCAGHGLTFTNAHNAIYPSLSYSLEEYWQSRDRLHRYGQTNKVTYHHVVAPDTIDEALVKVLAGKGDVARAAAAFVVGRVGAIRHCGG